MHFKYYVYQRQKKGKRYPKHEVIIKNIDGYSAGKSAKSYCKSWKLLSADENVAKRVSVKMRDGDFSGSVRILCSGEPVIAPDDGFQ